MSRFKKVIEHFEKCKKAADEKDLENFRKEFNIAKEEIDKLDIVDRIYFEHYNRAHIYKMEMLILALERTAKKRALKSKDKKEELEKLREEFNLTEEEKKALDLVDDLYCKHYKAENEK